MAEETQTTTDTSGITRMPDGQIVDGQTTKSDPTTTSEQTSTEAGDAGKTLLNQSENPPKAEGKSDTGTGGKAADKSKGTSAAPEKYADYTVPEGFTLAPEVKTQADTLFKDLNLSQEQGQKAIDLYTKLTSEAAQAPYKAWSDMTAKWKTDAESHPDLRGKLGAGKEVNVRIGALLNSLPDQQLASDFRELMDITGAGNHPAFIRAIDHWAKQLSEGTHVSGKGPSPGGQSEPGKASPSAAAAIWPGLKSSSNPR